MRFAATMFAAVLAIALQVGVAEARQGAPVEFARKNALPVHTASLRAPVRAGAVAVRPVSTSAPLELPEMLYGYGRASAHSERPALDLRGRLGAQTASALMDDDAFDDAPLTAASTQALASAEPGAGVGEAPAPALVPDAAPQPVEAPHDIPAPAAVSGAYFIQVGAFANPANAERARSSLGDVGLVTVDVRAGASATLHRVRLGGWATREEAERARDQIVERGFAGAIVASAR